MTKYLAGSTQMMMVVEMTCYSAKLPLNSLRNTETMTVVTVEKMPIVITKPLLYSQKDAG